MKKAVLPAALLTVLIAFPLFGDNITPPPWILGTWDMEYEGETMTLRFLERDITLDGESVAEMIAGGYITSFRQSITAQAYIIRVEYTDGFWWEESFPRPSMASTYTDAHNNGKAERLGYTRSEPAR